MEPPPEKTVFVPRAAAAAELFQTGDVVGQYQVERVLGRGGMGVVYLVRHTALKKPFALKALPAALAREGSFVARFKREAEMLARLKHAHIVNVTDFGENQGRLYLVLEYVDGGSVEEWFDQHRQGAGGAPAAEVRRLIAEVLRGLGHAHQAGVIHRDLKPANVLLEKTGEAKISDFGLARAVADAEYRRTGGTAAPFQGDSVTTTGTIVGTIDFMSPEARNLRPSDARSDIYAVGVMAYYLLTGRKPHGIAQPATRLVPGLDARWDEFIGTCLAEDPAKRYQKAEAALAVLTAMQADRGGQRWALALAVGAVVGAAGWFFLGSGSPAAPGSRPESLAVASSAGAVSVEVAASAEGGAAGPTAATPAEPGAAERVSGEAAGRAVVPRRFALAGLPPGAVATFRGRQYPAGAGGRVELELPPGAHAVRVRAPDFLDWEGEVGGDPEATEATMVMTPVPAQTVRFTGLPPRARLSLAGRSVEVDASGEAAVELRPGRWALSVEAPKYERLETAVEILANTGQVPLVMKRLPPPAEVVVALADGAALKFKWVPAGVFWVGSPPDERGRQRNDLARAKAGVERGFYLAETETTQRQHRALTGRNPSMSRALGDESRPVEQVAWRELTGPGGVLAKLTDVLQTQRLAFTADLPTEVEWEYACRAGTESAFNNGSDLTSDRADPALDELAAYARGTATEAPAPVARFKPNAWGLFDLHGNVAEWTYSVRGRRETVLRGGHWRAGAPHCRSASRVEVTPETRPTDVMGYRLVLRPVEE